MLNNVENPLQIGYSLHKNNLFVVYFHRGLCLVTFELHRFVALHKISLSIC